MLTRGGRLVFSFAGRKFQGHLRQVRVPLPVVACDWAPLLPCMKREDARSITTEVMGGLVNEERRRLLNRILYRSKQRGYLELDLLLGKWTTDHINHLDDKDLGALAEILEEENPDLLRWLTGQAEAPEKIANNPVFLAILKQVSEKLAEYSSVETRAQPGHPWVRGWDDNRKVGGPPVGNQ